MKLISIKYTGLELKQYTTKLRGKMKHIEKFLIDKGFKEEKPYKFVNSKCEVIITEDYIYVCTDELFKCNASIYPLMGYLNHFNLDDEV